MILCLLASLFIAIFAAFNIFVFQFIKNDAISQLSEYALIMEHHENEKGELKTTDNIKQAKNRTGTEVELFNIDGQYQPLDINNNTDDSSFEKYQQIADFLKSKQLDLNNISNMHVKTEDGEFYIVSMEDERQENFYHIILVDVTSVSNFAETINFMLIVIVMIAAVISFGIAAVIANAVNHPVKLLSGFAKQIGNGDFTNRDLPLIDKEFKELLEVMNRTASQLENYNHEQRTFFQNVSHEFRTPLMSIKCYAEGIQCGIMNPQDSSRIIMEETTRLSEMVEDLLVLSRMDNLTQKPEMILGDLRELISSCADSLNPVAQKFGVIFEYDFDRELVSFHYNEKYMARAINNLIMNGLRYAKSTIVLGCKTENNRVILTVHDDGEGIPETELPHIFERFYKGKKGNHGIGLSIVKSVVQLHNGEIYVSCHSGTSFLLEFPKD